ncbi:zinc ribbon domain-containing protein, partial [Streptomyces niveus]|uniref:zinc ribbon domain-containing protein n=1 Tax=Streptomyces niveus TaxID=193462 RepID=UPI0035D57FA6
MHQPTALSTCPSCEEPLESGDLFCGACGYDLSAVPPPPDDHPTIVMNGAPGTAPSGGVAWPAAAETDSTATPAPVQVPGELPGLDSTGVPLSGQTAGGHRGGPATPPPPSTSPASPAAPTAPKGDLEPPPPAPAVGV